MNRARLAGVLIAVFAAAGLVALGPVPQLARAADTTDQITGFGQTDSAVSTSWSDGILGADNKTVVSGRDPSSPTAFMHDDFKNLKVTVGQTNGLVHQAITVGWSGGKPTIGQYFSDYMQLMQCYGDENSGPSPENCEYGTPGLAGGAIGAWTGQRVGSLCTPRPSDPLPSTADPLPPANTNTPGCDAAEPSAPSHVGDTAAADAGEYNVPFIPVGTNQKIYKAQPVGANDTDPVLGDYFDQFNSNEVQQAQTRPDGTGQDFFEVLTATEAPGLGCGQFEGSGQPRDCWLVIVPRGEYEPNGFHAQSGSPVNNGQAVNQSPLGASNWANRIQIHLGFDPIGVNCPIGSGQERQTVGTELVAHAVFSWQLALNTAAKCKVIYGYAATPEATNTTQLSSPGGAGLAFTTIPIGSEGKRDGGSGSGTAPPVVYAPVAVSAMTFGFNINLNAGDVSTPVKLTPRLLAKALTQSYQNEIPSYAALIIPGWAKSNPAKITVDPEFEALNPGLGTTSGKVPPLAPLLTEDHSGVNQQVWTWIQSDPAARAWLNGQPDENGMVVNPSYSSLKLGASPATDSYPRADPSCYLDPAAVGERPPGACALDLLPYVNSLDDAAAAVRAGQNASASGWDQNAIAPDGQSGWFHKTGLEPPGQRFMWSVTDSASLANFGIVPASLCNANGSNCVAPSTSTVAAALNAAKADGTGLLHIDPAQPGTSGYPLVDVTYAAVRTDQVASALTDYATLLDYVAGPGQTAGVNPGQLPHGYLPLPDALRTQTRAAADTLRTDAAAQPHGPAGAGPSGQNADAIGAQQNGPGGSPVDATSGTSTAKSGKSGAAPDGTPSGISTSRLPAVAAAQSTPRDRVGAARWALLAVLLVGLAGAGAGPLIRNPGRLRRFVRFRQ